MNRARSPIQILPGSDALSAFRIERLLARLRRHVPQLAGLRVLDFFIVDADDVPLDALRRLLGAGPAAFPQAGRALYVVPRLGTVSPWSSKAADIARAASDSITKLTTPAPIWIAI